jgi:hypothetical protein
MSIDKLHQRFQIKEGWVAAILVVICLAAFGLLLPSLGFYWDDWWTLYIASTAKNPQALYYFNYRPLHAITDVFTVSLIGRAPIGWHILALVIRVITVLLLWRVLRRLWPQAAQPAAWAALFFAIYPIFLKQSMAVIFRQHWTSYALFLGSVLLMLRAAREPRRSVWLHGLGLLTMLAHLLFTEYFLGLELARPLLLWLVFSDEPDDRRRRAWKVFKNWLPYLLLWLAFVVWRLYFVEVLEDPNPPVLLYALLENPLSAIFQFLQLAARDLLHVFLTSWYPALEPELIDFSAPFAYLAWGVALVVAVLVAVVLRLVRFEDAGDQESRGWAFQAFWFGLLVTILGLLPTWVTGRDLLGGRYDDRLALPAMFGASLVFVALIYILVSKSSYRHVILCALVGLAVGLHLRMANDFRWDWTLQNRQLWQMYWRAPDIEDGTPLVANGNFTTYVSRYSASYAINTFYGKGMKDGEVPLWYFEYRYDKLHRIVPELVQGTEISGDLYGTAFSGNSLDSLLIYAAPQEEHCLWLLNPADTAFELLPDEMRQMAQVIDLSRISPEPASLDYPPLEVFQLEPAHTWCYFYQKMELARQLEDWPQIMSLWQQAQDGGHVPQHGYEYVAIVLAEIHQGEYAQEVNLTQEAYHRSEGTASLYCSLWAQSAEDLSGLPQFISARDEVVSSLSCKP